MLGSPAPARGRRRRLIQAFAPSNAENYYTSVSSTASRSSFRRRRQSPKIRSRSSDARTQRLNAGNAKSKSTISMGFRPIDPKADHGYRINVARDGSMITAVPIEEQPLRGAGGNFTAPQRPPALGVTSPILFSQPRSSPNGTNSNGSVTWSQQGLLDARGKQRHKMKRLKPYANVTSAGTNKSTITLSDDDPFPIDPSNDVIRTARDKIKAKHAKGKGFLAFTGTHHKHKDESAQQNQHQLSRQESGKPPTPPTQLQRQHIPRSRSKSKPKVRWDLSPKPPPTQSQQDQMTLRNPGNFDDADMSVTSFPFLSGHTFDESVVDDGEEEKKSSNDNAADHKIEENAENANMIPEKKVTQSFETLVQQRMAEIQSQQKELAEKISKKDVIKGTLITAIDGNLEKNRNQMRLLDDELKELQWHLDIGAKKQQQHQILRAVTKREEVDVARNRLPRSLSEAYDMYSVEIGDPSITADTDSVAALFQKACNGRESHGLDPPARPGQRTVEEELHPSYRREQKEPDGPRISTILRGKVFHAGAGANAADVNTSGGIDEPSIRIPSPPTIGMPFLKSVPFRPVPIQNYQQIQASRQQHHRPRQEKKILPPPQSQKRGKVVHFNLPNDSDSTELKFTAKNGDTEDISWKEEHIDVEAYDKEAGSFISAKHDDLYRRNESEHYSRENHHEATENEIGRSPVWTNDHNENRVVSTDSEANPDLGFIHTVAAVVIQTAVRRFLAEIAVEERLYAVNVIQTAICNWMALMNRNPRFSSNSVFYEIRDEQVHAAHNWDETVHDPNQPISRQIPPRRKKSVMFEDDYNKFRNFAATEIQRCYRGWWARDGLEVDRFAATTIQRLFRGWWAREALEVDHYCAVEIQRIVRGHLSRMSYIYDLYCIIVVQSVVRRYLSFFTSAFRLANILYIQAIFRGYRVRSELMRYVRNGQEVAATFIQNQWRSYDAHMNYINTLADILIVQSVARRWLTLRKMRGERGMKPRSADYERSNNLVERKRNTDADWQRHRLNVVKRPPANQLQYSHRDGINAFHRDSVGCEDWYDGNKSETSDMLKNWKKKGSI